MESDICARKRVNQQLSEEAVGKEKMSIITCENVEKFSAFGVSGASAGNAKPEIRPSNRSQVVLRQG